MNKFETTIQRKNEGTPPVWFMRQAGRYHSHYQGLKRSHSFMDLCKKPELACEVTMGPIRDFDFDAAILFSDLLFPLEAMGMGLKYEVGPQLDWHLKSKADLARLKGGAELASFMNFQGEAMKLIRAALPKEKGLIGFVGAPTTLFFYAVAGSHKGDLSDAHVAMKDGRFEGFCEKLFDLLAYNMAIQAKAGADTIALFDTCAGDLDPETYATQAVPAIAQVIKRFHAICPGFPITYYSKKTNAKHWRALENLPITTLGIDWNTPIEEVLSLYGDRFSIQGNIDPDWLFLPEQEFKEKCLAYFSRVKKLPLSHRKGWVAGLGHGVLPKTPESNVKLYIKLLRENFPEKGRA